MADVGLGQLVSTTGRYRSKIFKDAVSDAHPLMAAFKENDGIRRIPGGRTVVTEALSGQNSTVSWVGEAGQVNLSDQKVVDAAEFSWKYILGSVSWTLAERYKNSGGGDIVYGDIVAKKFKVLEASMRNTIHTGMLSAGTGTSGLQLGGLAALISTTPTTGTVGTINRASADAVWYRNQKFDTSADWSDGAVNAGNVKRFFDKGINGTTRDDAVTMVDIGFLGQTHFEFLTSAIQAIQVINDNTGTGKAGFQKLVYRGIPMYFGAGINFSGLAAMTATRSYLLCTKEGGVNLVYHNKAEYDMLEPVNSSDQAAISRLMFTMLTMELGGYAAFNWVGFD